MRSANAVTHPDDWGAGLWFKAKCLNVKTVSRAATPVEVLREVFAHNLREDNAHHRHRSPIDPARTPSNLVLLGPKTLAAAIDVAQSIMDALGLTPRRRDAIVAIEMVVQPPADADQTAFWAESLNWALAHYEHVVSAIVHLDQRRPHLHIVALAIQGGRLAGNEMTSGARRIALQRRDFFRHMRDTLGIRRDRPAKTMAQLAVSTGRGATTPAAAARRDAALVRDAGAEWQPPVGPHPDGVRRDSRANAGRQRGEPERSISDSYIVPASSVRLQDESLASLQAPVGARLTPIAPPESVELPTAPSFSRERDSEHSADEWDEQTGEFVKRPAPERRFKQEAKDLVKQALLRRQEYIRKA